MEDIIDRYRNEVILDGLKLETPLPKVGTGKIRGSGVLNTVWGVWFWF